MGLMDWTGLGNGVVAALGWSSESFSGTNSTLRSTSRKMRCDGKTATGKIHRLISPFLLLITLPQSVFGYLPIQQQPKSFVPKPFLSSRASNQSSSLLDVIQVSQPVLSPENATCKQVLMEHSFAYSYGKPFVGHYVPPSCDFNRVTFNLTVTSAGRQYDRLALMFFGDTEIFRTSTAEPTQSGIIWSYVKDMSNLLVLFKEPQKIIFDLGNLVDDTYTGLFNTTLTATFFNAESTSPADIIVPVSAQRSASNSPSGFTVPDQQAVNTVTLPQNVKKAVFSIAACGQAAEEFWWSNVLSSDIHAFGNDTTLYGYSPFRELQLLIDGTLAGVVWPFPVIFTGGVVPGFWRPVVGIDAFDLLEDEIDISPFLPVLSDGKDHTFEIRVAGINDDGQGNGELTEMVGSNWIVTGKVFIWLDPQGSVTTGTALIQTAPKPVLALHSSRSRNNGTVTALDYFVKVQRTLSISSTITTSTGTKEVNWEQNLTYSNDGRFKNNGNDQTNNQTISGIATSSSGYSRAFSYPLWVYSLYETFPDGNFTIDATMDRAKNVQQVGQLALLSDLQSFDFGHFSGQKPDSFTGTTSMNHQNGNASYLSVPAEKKSYGSGITEQFLTLDGITAAVATAPTQGGARLYKRHVLANNNTIVFDEDSFGEMGAKSGGYAAAAAGKQERQTFALVYIRKMLGRGPVGRW
ncbi:hypothetical protein GQ43DRAFT_121191 [Delitschia confertaspora ATCC 74209]|uniref:Peptide N-acetyl-beta-D-glucosaminyl asparaginase amidase A N-terminal domain-containing protein n=1 Tax=Delitschia confertaspora ATCC 74209 TaxID=1513339 RepID=A0A9P4MW44_9PLEO|nr:hypothetical protein GQ43DRAFT_121191 [Delitschia confertaspora ATCC 74209]